MTPVGFRSGKAGSNHGDSVTDGSPHENPQSGDLWDFNRLEQFQEKCETVFRPELRKNKDLERSTDFEETDFEEEVIRSGQKSHPRQKGP